MKRRGGMGKKNWYGDDLRDKGCYSRGSPETLKDFTGKKERSIVLSVGN